MSTKRDIATELALKYDIEVRRAKRLEDIELEAIHTLDPTIEQVMDAIIRALELGVDLVMVHSKLQWPYSHN